MASVPDYAVKPPAAGDPGEFPRWPLWGPLVAIFIGLAVTLTVGTVVVAVAQAGGGNLKTSSPGFTALSTLLLDLGVVGGVVGIAAMTARPHLWQFGLRRAP